ncbi:MAG: hypothetical protein RI972_1664 [Pseudomonadota bacterium]
MKAPQLSRRQLCVAATLALAGCASEPRQPPTRVLTVPERVWDGESPDLADRVSARVLIATQAGSVSTLDVRRWREGLKTHPAMRTAVGDTRGRFPPIWELSNPDAHGAFVALVSDVGDRRHALRLMHPLREARVLRREAGDPLWDRAVSGMALSPDGRYLAMVVQADPTARYRPLHMGRLVVMDLAAPTSADGYPPEPPMPAAADGFPWVLGQRPAWINGGQQLLVASAGPRGRSTADKPAAPALQADPLIEVIDLRLQTRTAAASGHSVVASGQGSGFLVAHSSSYQWSYAAGPGRPPRAIPRRHGLGTPVALIDERYLLFTGAPHPESPRELTANNSPLVGPKLMLALKLMDLENMAVLTLLEGIDPRRRITAAPSLVTEPPRAI